MKRKFLAFMVLLTAGLSLSSCLSTNDYETEYTHDTAVTAFSLGTMTRSYYTKSSKTGNDTLLTASVTGSNYKFYIDQTTRQIYNPDSLPYRTKVSAVLATITAKNSSPMVWMKMNVDSVQASYSSSDSVDFSSPRKLRVYSNSVDAYVTYTVKVNVHQEKPDSFVWHSLATKNANIGVLKELKGVNVGQNVFIFGTDGQQLKIYKTGLTDGRSWSEVTPNIAFDKDAWQDVISYGGSAYLLNKGTLYQSTDASTWQSVATGTPLTRLIGASTNYLYGYTADGISVSKDNGLTWTAETIDAPADSLPTRSVSLNITGIASTRNAENLLLLGVHDKTSTHSDSVAVVWTRTIDYERPEEGKWNYVDYDRAQLGKLPYAKQVLVAGSDSGYVAVASNNKWYRSINGGLRWSVDTLVTMPSAFVATERFAFFRDSNNFYWLVNATTGNVWKGRYNRDGWVRKD